MLLLNGGSASFKTVIALVTHHQRLCHGLPVELIQTLYYAKAGLVH